MIKQSSYKKNFFNLFLPRNQIELKTMMKDSEFVCDCD